jgi:hypothetical protein
MRWDRLRAIAVVAVVLLFGYWLAKDAGVLPDWSKWTARRSPLRVQVDKAALIGELEEVRDRLREMHDRGFASYDSVWEANKFGVRADIAFTSGGVLCNSPYREQYWQLRREHQRWKRLFSIYAQVIQKALIELPRGDSALLESYGEVPSEVNGFLDEVKFSVDDRNRKLERFLQMVP